MRQEADAVGHFRDSNILAKMAISKVFIGEHGSALVLIEYKRSLTVNLSPLSIRQIEHSVDLFRDIDFRAIDSDLADVSNAKVSIFYKFIYEKNIPLKKRTTKIKETFVTIRRNFYIFYR